MEENRVSTPINPADLEAPKSQIVEQNQRFLKSSEINNNRMRDIAQFDINCEQTDSLQELIELWQGVPYDELAKSSLRLEAAIVDAQSSLDNPDTLSEDNKERLAQLQADAALAISLAPKRSDDIHQVETEEKTKIVGQLVDDIRQELDDIYEQMQAYGEAWPIPLAMSPEDRTILYNELTSDDDTEASVVIEDIIPVSIDERKRRAEIVKNAKSLRVVENPDASVSIAYYLSQKVTNIVTVDELADFLYKIDPKIKGNTYRNRITTLLGPEKAGKRIQHILENDYALFLQYGWRTAYIVDENGRKVQIQRVRIYSASQGPAAPSKSYPTPYSWDGEYLAGQDSGGRDIYFKDVLTSTKPIDEAEIRANPTASDTADDKASHTEDLDSQEIKDDWKEIVKSTAQEAIDRLMADGLFFAENIKARTISGRSSSKILATKTNLERMKEAGFYRVGDVRRGERNLEMDREHRVIGLILNPLIGILGQKGKRQQEAVEIIRNVIEDNLKIDQKSAS